MKFKKSWIFWICYYSIFILANVIAAILLREKWHFTAFSAFPIGYIAILSFLAVFLPSELAEKHSEQYHKGLAMFYEKYLDEEEYDRQNNMDKEGAKEVSIFFSRTCLVCIPFFFMFILFFPNGVKAASALFLLVVWVPAIYICIWRYIGYRDDHDQITQELEEQKKKEELGKWK